MKRIIFLFLVLSVISCSKKPCPLKSDQFIAGLAMPLRLDKNQDSIMLQDFVPESFLIDSVFLNKRRINLSEDKSMALMPGNMDLLPLMELKIWKGGTYQSVLVMKSRKIDYVFTFDPDNKKFKNVWIAGEFNGWTPSRTVMEYVEGNWKAVISLDPGRYQYQLVTDGKWIIDPTNPDSVDNNAGAFNSVISVGLINEDLLPLLYTDKIEKDGKSFRIRWDNKPSDVFVFWQNFRLDESYLEYGDEGMKIMIPREAANMERSFVRVFAFNEYGISNELLIPLQSGNIITETSALKRTDKEAQIIYNVFVDRFYNGNPGNDEPVDDPSLVLPPADYYGGDIAGITNKVKEGYFEKLGVNTLWISPIVLNPKGAYGQWNDPPTKFSAYHGYWPISFTEIDPRMGTADEFMELITEAHKRGMNVLLDFVAHHVHELHPYYIEHPEWTTSLYLPDGTLNTEKWDEHRLTTWFDVFLPTLDLQQPEVTEMLSDSAVWWISKYQLDGFRHDATKHVPEIFWRTLTRKLKQQVVRDEGRPIYQIGETYGGPGLISSYVGSGMLDGQFDFNVYDAALGVFARESDPFTNLDRVLQTSFDFYGNHNLMGYITGNQDRGRFISYAGGDLKFDENAKLAGWKRTIGVGDTLAYQKLSMLTAFNMTIPGIPVIYYGDEVGIPGGNDPDSRRPMKFDALSTYEAQTYAVAAKLARIRGKNMALLYGNFTTLDVTAKNYAFSRQYFDQYAIVVFNKSDQPVTYTVSLPAWWKENPALHAKFGHSFSIENKEMSLELGPWSFEILVN